MADLVETALAPRPEPEGATPPAVVIGLAAHNGQAFIAQTLRSLLTQSFRDFRLVILDDGSGDETGRLILQEAAGDDRVSLFRHPEGHGMIAAWRRVFALAHAHYPQTAWFAWASDHDVLDPGWLAALYAHARAHPEAAAVYPVVRNITAKGKTQDHEQPRYESREPDPIRRFTQVQAEGVGFGNVIYGLIRIDLLERAGVFRRVLAPDRLAVLELCLQGELHQVPEALRLRRITAAYSIDRQKRALFGPAGPPAYSDLAFFLPHAGLLLKHRLGDGGLRWKVRLIGAVAGMILDQTWRQTVGKRQKTRKREAARAAKGAPGPVSD